MSRSKSVWDVADHRARRTALQAARLAQWWLAPGRWPPALRYVPERDGALDVLVHEVRVPLARKDPFAEATLEAGKRQNLALAAPVFDGLVASPARPLSFWRALGRADARRGFTWGMELRGGCVVPAIAGGLCLLTNALFEVAARAGFRILERHGHSMEAIPPEPGSLVLDATVAWPDRDLVIAPREGAARLAVAVEGDTLRVASFMARAPEGRVELSGEEWVERRGEERLRQSRVVRRHVGPGGEVLFAEEIARSERRMLHASELGRSCLTCGEHACRDRPSEGVLVALRRRGP